MPSPSSSSSSSSSNSDNDSSSEDENWAALQSVVVDAAQVHAGAQKAKEQAQRRKRAAPSGGPSGEAADDNGADAARATDNVLDAFQLKIAAMLDERIGRTLAALGETKLKKRKQDKEGGGEDQEDPASSSGKGKETSTGKGKESGGGKGSSSEAGVWPCKQLEDGDEQVPGMRFFRRVKRGVPAVLPAAPVAAPELVQAVQPGVLARTRILAGTRYEAQAQLPDSSLAALAAEADDVAEAAAKKLRKLKEPPATPAPKPTSPAAAAAAAGEGGAGTGGGVEGVEGREAQGEGSADKKKKKKKKKVKQEGVVVEAERGAFVPHEQRMVALLGH